MQPQQLVMDIFRRAALVLVGHGSAHNANSSRSTRRLAEVLRRRNLFAEVIACFWKETPPLRAALSIVNAEKVFVVPNFAGVGYFTHEIIPREIGLSGPLTAITDVSGRTRYIHYTPPVGAHPRLALLVYRRVETVVVRYSLDWTTLCLLLVGHGSHRSGGSSETAEALATALRRQGEIGTVCTAYLEQEPMVVHWRSLVSARDVLVVPLLVSEGLHGSEDLPQLFGLSATDLLATNHLSVVGPVLTRSHRIWYCRGIGSDPDMINIILDQVMNSTR